MLHFFKARPEHINNKKLSHDAWMAYCWAELYAGPKVGPCGFRQMFAAKSRLQDLLKIDGFKVEKILAELGKLRAWTLGLDRGRLQLTAPPNQIGSRSGDGSCSPGDCRPGRSGFSSS